MDDFSRDEDAKFASKLEVRRSYAGHRMPHAVFRPEGKESALPGEARSSGEGPSARLGLKVPLAVLVFYVLVVVGATYPRVTMVRDTLPGYRCDPLCHLWGVRSRQCQGFPRNPGRFHPGSGLSPSLDQLETIEREASFL